MVRGRTRPKPEARLGKPCVALSLIDRTWKVNMWILTVGRPGRRPASGAHRAGDMSHAGRSRTRSGRLAGSRLANVSRMTKWEYSTVPLLVHATKQILDNWGQDGWELVQVVPGPNPEQLVAYLKRPKQ